MHEVLVNRLGGLSLPKKSVVRLTDRPDMTLDVYRGPKKNNTTTTTIWGHLEKGSKYVNELLPLKTYPFIFTNNAHPSWKNKYNTICNELRDG